MKNTVFIDAWLPVDEQKVSDALSAAGYPHTVDVAFSPVGCPADVKRALEDDGHIGRFAIATRCAETYLGDFPNNTVAFDGDLPKLGRSLNYVLTEFGRDYRSETKVFVTSDTHFWHANIIRYCNRPWKTAEEMNDEMVRRWNSVVGKDDVVIHLGDFSFGSREKVKSVFDRLNGRIDLVMGNHDRLRVSDYYAMGFHRVYDRPILYDGFFLLSHAPVQWVRDGDVYANVYGHVHDMEMYRTCTRNTFCACVERHEYRPVPFGDIKEAMKRMDKMEETK